MFGCGDWIGFCVSLTRNRFFTESLQIPHLMHTKICKRNKTTNYLKRFHFFTHYDVEYNILSVYQYPITQIVGHLFCEGTKPSFFFAVNNGLLCLRCTVSSVSYNMDVVSNNKGQIDTLSIPWLTINGWLTLTLSNIMVTLLLELAASVSIADKIRRARVWTCILYCNISTYCATNQAISLTMI